MCIYKIAMTRKRKTRNLSHISVLRTMTEEYYPRMRRSWIDGYNIFSIFLIHTSEKNLRKNISQRKMDHNFQCRIRAKELKPLEKMKSGKMVGLENINKDMEVHEKNRLQHLIKLFSIIFEASNMLDLWTHNNVCPMYKRIKVILKLHEQ